MASQLNGGGKYQLAAQSAINFVQKAEHHGLSSWAMSRAQGFVEAAEVFMAESGTQPGVDLPAITDRMEIRKALQSGNIEDAIDRVNDLNPEVGCTLAQQQVADLHLCGQGFAQECKLKL